MKEKEFNRFAYVAIKTKNNNKQTKKNLTNNKKL